MLTDYMPDRVQTISHANIVIVDDTPTILVAAVEGSRIKIHQLKLSTSETASLTVSSGSRTLFVYQITGSLQPTIIDKEDSQSKMPLFITENGEAFMIQSSHATPNGNVYIQYSIEENR